MKNKVKVVEVTKKVTKKRYSKNTVITGAIPEITTLYGETKMLYRFLYSVQKEAIGLENIVRNRTLAGQIVSPKMTQLSELLRLLESEAEKVITKEILPYIPIWKRYLKNVKGCGARLAGSLIGQIGDPAKFNNISSLWSYFGYDVKHAYAHCEGGNHRLVISPNAKTCPIFTKVEDKEGCVKIVKCGSPVIIDEVFNTAPKKKVGRHFCYCGDGRTTTWKLVGCFMKQSNEFYREIYDSHKAQQLAKGIKLGHAHNRALRKAGKVFLANLWLNWRLVDGLSIRAPYPIEHMEHTKLLLDPAGDVSNIRQKIDEYNAIQLRMAN